MKTSIQNKILIIVALVISFIATFMFSSQRLPVYDDICYLFIFDDTDLENQDLLRPVNDFHDVIESQTWHYFNVNGRAPVHFMVQIFENLLNYKWFGLFNALFYISFIICLIYYIQPKKIWNNPLLWIIVCLCVQYMFPYGLGCNIGPWYSVAMGFNYLWTGTLFILFLLIWKIYKDVNSKWYKCFIFCLLGLFTGWSNEAFALPLSTGLFFYYFIYPKEKFKTNSECFLSLFLWIGTVLLVFAPGTFNRIENQSEISIFNLFITFGECYLNIKFFWILLITFIFYYAKNKSQLKKFVRDNILLCIIFIIAIALSVFAHTMPHSLLCIELISMILLVKLFINLINKFFLLISNLAYILSWFIIILYAFHISFVLRANANQYKIFNQMIIDFKNSPDGVVNVDYPKYNNFIDPFVDDIDMHLSPGVGYSMQLSVFTGERNKQITALSEIDYKSIIINPTKSFTKDKLIPGSANLYDTGGKLYYFAPLDSLQNLPNNYKIVASFEGDSFTKSLPLGRRIVYKLIGNRKPPKELNSFILKTRNGYYLVAKKILSTPSRIDIVVEDS